MQVVVEVERGELEGHHRKSSVSLKVKCGAVTALKQRKANRTTELNQLPVLGPGRPLPIADADDRRQFIPGSPFRATRVGTDSEGYPIWDKLKLDPNEPSSTWREGC